MISNLPPNLPLLKAGWSYVKLGDVGQIVTGTTPPKNNLKNYGDFVPLYKPSDLNIGTNILHAKDNLSKIGIENARLLPKGSILVTCIGATIGKTGLIKRAGASNQQINAIVPGPNFISEFIYYFCISENFQKQILKNASSTTLPILNKSKFEKLTIPLPPLPVQKKNVEKIEELFSQLDSGVASLKKAKEQIRLYRQSVLASAFSGKLVNAAYLNGVQGVTNKKAERLNAIQEFSRAAEPKVEFSNQLPDGWEWVKLEEVLTFLGSGVTPRGGRNVYKTEGIKFIRSQNVYPNQLVLEDIAYITNAIDDKMERSRVKPLDVLLNITGASIGRAANIPESFGPANVNQHVCILRTNQNELRSKYLSLYLNSNFAQQHINRIQIGATRQALNYSQIKMFPFPLCPVNQQTQIVEEIEKRFSEADNLEKAIDDSLKKSEALRQSILKQAFEGRLV